MTTTDNGRRELSVADMFNSTVAAAALGAAWELGALDELHRVGALDVDSFATEGELHLPSVEEMFRALASVGIVERDNRKVRPGRAFAAAYRAKPLFYWLWQGSGELFAGMPALLRNANRVGTFYHRDAKAVSYASRQANATFFDPVFRQAMRPLEGRFSTVVDLGSGSGERVIQIAEENPAVRAYGLDIADEVVAMANEEAERRGLADRVTFLTADVRELSPRPEFAGTELLTCFMMGHDLWPRDEAIVSLRRLRELFPNVRRFLLGDTVRTVGIPDEEIPVFTLGFELGHTLMGQYLPTAEEWRGVFAEGGWRCVGEHGSDVLAGTVVFELE